ncbi:serine/threonine-protein kinase mos [Cylas formicarius]|uniref:serine/threonine-protein kinase mos n=1 Tax=Cylas formicarius TaxID=197179 RepID=UPI002958646E|nr:serine/threonine-protein kinase mos [Cylas formicarius]
MGTPLRNIAAKFFSPKVLSPRGSGSLRQSTANEVTGVVRKLHFSEKSRDGNTKSPLIPQITIDGADYNSKSVELNTPNKSNLLTTGLDHFRNAAILGRGQYGTVFKGEHKGKMVAVKLIRFSNNIGDENAVKLDHENVVRILDIVKSPGQNFCLVIMDFIAKGRDLQHVLEEGEDVDSGVTKKFVVGITSGVKYCHENGVLHLDLKPKNILVDARNVCKICDFGNSVKIGETLERFNHKGTIVYTAPEILLGRLPSTKSDVYSLGLILWQIKYRKNPFDGVDNNQTIIYNVVKSLMKPFENAKCADVVSDILMKCWNTDPNDRPTTVEILNYLEKF